MSRIPLLIAVAMLITLSTGTTLAATRQMDQAIDGSNPKNTTLCKQKCGGNGGGERKRSGSGGGGGSGGSGERKRDGSGGGTGGGKGSGTGDCNLVG
jgi:hypothetical protein